VSLRLPEGFSAQLALKSPSGGKRSCGRRDPICCTPNESSGFAWRLPGSSGDRLRLAAVNCRSSFSNRAALAVGSLGFASPDRRAANSSVRPDSAYRLCCAPAPPASWLEGHCHRRPLRTRGKISFHLNKRLFLSVFELSRRRIGNSGPMPPLISSRRLVLNATKKLAKTAGRLRLSRCHKLL
jgi:hypothetical protein